MTHQDFSPVLVFDFGGTKLCSAVVDVSRGIILSQVILPTPNSRNASTSIEVIVEAGRKAIAALGAQFQDIQSIGISFGGPVSKDRRFVVRSMHVRDWDHLDLPKKLEEIFQKPAFMDNDANAAALGEWNFGTGKGAENLLYIQVSTGIGAGLIIQRKLYRGRGLAGEFGHITVQLDGPLCTCGKSGCIESLASGWAIARDAQLLIQQKDSARLNELCQNDPTQVNAELVFRASQDGDAAARKLIDNALRFLAVGIANAICLIDPDVVVIGGGVARSQVQMWEIIEPYLNQFLPPLFQTRNRITFAELHGRETLLGAALLTQGH